MHGWIWTVLTTVAFGQDWVIEAERMHAADGETVAEQAEVHAIGGDWHVTADRIRLTEEGAFLDQGRLVFGDDRAIRFAAATWRDGAWVLTETELEPCNCDGADPWSVRAREARVDGGGDSVAVRGAWFQVLDQPILPVPSARVPLTRRSGLLTPELGVGEQGLRVAQPVYLTLGEHADTTLTPEVRTQRGARLNHEIRWAERHGGGTWLSDLTRDSVTETWRGASSVDLSSAGQRMRAALRGQWVSDGTYLADWGARWLDRRQPWTNQRAVLAAGPVEATLLGVQADAPTLQTATALWRPHTQTGPLDTLWTVQAGGGATWLGDLPTDVQDPQALGWTQLDVDRPTWVGPVLVEPVLNLRGGIDPSGWDGTGAAGTTARLPFWRAQSDHLERIEPGWGAWVDSADGGDWRTGPVLRISRMGRHRLLWEGRAWTDGASQGLQSMALLQREWLRGRAWVDLDERGLTAESSLGVQGGRSSMDVGAIRADRTRVYTNEDLAQAWAAGQLGLPDPKATLHVRSHLRTDLDSGIVREIGAGSGWTHPSGCARVDLRSTWVDDRTRPDVALDVRLSL